MVIETEKKSDYSLEKSIRYRLVAVILPLMIILVFLVHQSMHLLVDGIVVGRLKQDSESLISSLAKTDSGWEVDQRYLPHVYQRVKSGHYYLLQLGDSLLRSRSLWDKKVDVASFKAGDTEDYLYHKIDGELWVIHRQEFSKDGQQFTLWMVEDIAQIEEEQVRYRYTLLAALVLFVAAFVFWQSRVLKKGFSRLDPIHQAIRSNQLSGTLRFPEQVPQEIKPLVDSIALLIDRSNEQVARSRMSVGNLAHELKRPLQELRLITTVMEDEGEREKLQRICDELQRRVDSELRRARISGSPMPGNLFSFEEELPHLKQILDRVHRRTIALETKISQQTIPFDRDDMIELLGNLLDNGWKYTDSKVLLNVEQQGDEWTLLIEDDGPGIDTDLIERASKRGERIDEQSDRKGDGLGLSICQSIVASYGGSISFQRSSQGGLMVKVTLNRKLVN